ncbi:hypothetical protein HUO05_23860 (plasmid) [Vibrio alginolyticus]|uniref:hypothetical protein n=1 Tax=Vibrio alginolyticus TaxID=663 RepID=UPI0015949352|nr:hypothetical protein [Vibrio alginolyticus]QKS98237.1 hypothetical protein HUO05_23860 [Vibrio alginolyticus]
MKHIKIVDDESLSTEQLIGLDPELPITLELSGFSGGGVFEMQSFTNKLSLLSDVRVHVSGLVAGTGMWPLGFAKKITADKDALFCFLNSQAVSFGSPSDMEATAKLLDEVDAWSKDLFLDRFGINLDDIKDKWLSVSEMKALGVPIEVIEMD